MNDDKHMKKLMENGPKFYEIGYYADYFNVSTFDVLIRMRKSLWPFCSKSGIFVDDDSLDLYGPIWIMITLIVEIAIVGYVNNVIDASAHDMQY
jgi:hypothetical protein